MTGLRSRQKVERNLRIIEASTKLFKRKGYEATRIEDIAEEAGLSQATFYNYFHNKGDLLLATLLLEMEAVLAAGQRIISRKHTNALKALNELILAYYENTFVYVTREMWQEAMSVMISQPKAPFSRQYLDVDLKLCGQISTLLSDLQKRGHIRSDLDPAALGQFIFHNVNMTFMSFVRAEDMTAGHIEKIVKSQNEVVYQLITGSSVPRIRVVSASKQQ